MKLNRLRNWKLCLALLCGMTLMACGGGGGGDTPVATPTPTPTPTPQLNILQVEVTEDSNKATITWLTDRAATDVVQYGTTTGYGSQVANATAATSHRVELPGLTTSTLYHFKITSTDPDGIYLDDVYESNFTTAAAPITGPSSIQSDDFNIDKTDFNTDPVWTFYDPVGLGSATASGGNLELSLPSGTAHDAWEPDNYAARLMQTVKDEDFTLTVKFVSPVTKAYQDQGIMIEESGDNWMRFDVYYNNDNEVKMYVARIYDADADNVADIQVDADIKINPQPSIGHQPYYLRVTRSISSSPNWKFEYSLDSTNGTDGTWTEVVNFNHSITVNTIGPYAGNYSIPSSLPVPDHTALVDFFTVSFP